MTFLNEEAWQGRVYSGGWITSDGGDTAVIEPATGRELGRIGLATPDDVTRAVKMAAATQSAWAALPHTERSAILRRAAAIWEANAPEIEDWVIRESGKIGGAAAFETHNSTQEIYEAATLPSRPNEQTVDDEANVPFGGIFDSGTGTRFGGTANLDAFTETRWITIRGDIAAYPF
jgi:benzaldehyde dehydrogenase (NAD)